MSAVYVDQLNELSIDAQTNSTITSLSLYSDRARITRSLDASVAAGQNRITLTHLPNVMDHDSLRYYSACSLPFILINS